MPRGTNISNWYSTGKENERKYLSNFLNKLIFINNFFKVKIQGQNEEMLSTACEQFLGKSQDEIHNIALVTLEGHQRAIMGSMTVEV